jgi:hypothetical protein
LWFGDSFIEAVTISGIKVILFLDVSVGAFSFYNPNKDYRLKIVFLRFSTTKALFGDCCYFGNTGGVCGRRRADFGEVFCSWMDTVFSLLRDLVALLVRADFLGTNEFSLP